MYAHIHLKKYICWIHILYYLYNTEPQWMTSLRRHWFTSIKKSAV